MKKLETYWHLVNNSNFNFKTTILILKIWINQFSLNFIDEYDDEIGQLRVNGSKENDVETNNYTENEKEDNDDNETSSNGSENRKSDLFK